MRLVRGLAIIFICISLLACAGAQVEHKKNQKIAESNWRLGVGYYRQGKVDASLEKFKKALKAAPNYPEAHSSIALVYMHLDEYEKAREHYEAALELQPESGDIHNNYATLLCKIGKQLEAEPHFLKAINSRRYRTPAQALENLGSCMMQVPDFKKAEKYLRQALKINPRLPGALFQMARVGIEKKSYMSGRAYLQRYHEVVKINPKSLMLGVEIENKLGDKKTVLDYKSQLRRDFPDSDETKKLMENEFGKRER